MIWHRFETGEVVRLVGDPLRGPGKVVTEVVGGRPELVEVEFEGNIETFHVDTLRKAEPRRIVRVGARTRA